MLNPTQSKVFAQNGRGFTRDLFKLFSGLRYCFRYNCRNLLDTNVSIKGFVPPDSAAKITDIFKSNNSKDDLCEQVIGYHSFNFSFPCSFLLSFIPDKTPRKEHGKLK